MYITMCEIDAQYRFYGLSRATKAGLWGNPEGKSGKSGEGVGVQGVGTHVSLWLIYVDV